MPDARARKAITLDTDPGIGTPGSDVDAFFWPPVATSSLGLTVIQVALTRYMTEFVTYWRRIRAGSMLATIPIVVLFFVLQKYEVQSVASTGATG